MNSIKKYLILFFTLLALVVSSCKKFLDVDPPKALVDAGQVFTNDVTALSAVSAIYIDLLSSNSFANGDLYSTTALASLSADELYMNDRNDLENVQFDENDLNAFNSKVSSLWESMYKVIYQSNAAIEGLENAEGTTAAVNSQLRGECYFLRAFTYFYLVNTFGKVPLVTGTDYNVNKTTPRTDAILVYDQIISDLNMADQLLLEKYPTTERTRINKYVAKALLSRVYLFRKDWANAESYASDVIDSTVLYSLPTDVNEVFLASSSEAIWQLKSFVEGLNTYEGAYFIAIDGQQFFIMDSTLVSDFSDDDSRKTSWIGWLDRVVDTIPFPYKYKVQYSTDLTEYSMVLRLAEQFLIRAEARANQNKLSEAIADLDMVRGRAGVTLIAETNPGISQQDLLLAIEHERRLELFTEWGHRWYDLKRTGRADAILSAKKAKWSPEDVLYPIPATEFINNPFLGDQNAGY